MNILAVIYAGTQRLLLEAFIAHVPAPSTNGDHMHDKVIDRHTHFEKS